MNSDFLFFINCQRKYKNSRNINKLIFCTKIPIKLINYNKNNINVILNISLKKSDFFITSY